MVLHELCTPRRMFIGRSRVELIRILYAIRRRRMGGITMIKKKHILDWYIENTPSDEKEYDNGCLAAFVIVAIIFVGLSIGMCLIE